HQRLKRYRIVRDDEAGIDINPSTHLVRVIDGPDRAVLDAPFAGNQVEFGSEQFMMDAKDVRQAAHFLDHCSETAIALGRLCVDRNEAAHLWRDLADSFDNADVKAVQGGTLFKPGCPDC